VQEYTPIPKEKPPTPPPPPKIEPPKIVIPQKPVVEYVSYEPEKVSLPPPITFTASKPQAPKFKYLAKRAGLKNSI